MSGKGRWECSFRIFPKAVLPAATLAELCKLERDGGCRRSSVVVGMELASEVSGQFSLVQVSQCRTGLAGEVLVLLVHACKIRVIIHAIWLCCSSAPLQHAAD